MIKSIFVIILLLVSQAFAQQYIDLTKTLFGVEYSFQDRDMVNEPGRNTMSTPHKQQKLREMIHHYLQITGLPQSSVEEKYTWKPGFYINVPSDGQYVINTEPVTIEFNTTPKKLSELKSAAEPIYKAAALANLKPYVNPAAERSGMGHIHVGGWTLQDSPFYRHENLLRNVIAFFHKHPALLYGFAEAYDIGKASNIETLHEETRQKAIQEIFAEYDKNISQENHANGLLLLIDLLKRSNKQVNWTPGGGFQGFFAHYRFINLEHVQRLELSTPPETAGKFTIEFRMFRPPPSAEHTEALGKLLTAVFDHLAKPGHIEKFETISESKFREFMTGTRVAADWEELRKILNLNDIFLDSMVDEFVETIHSKVIKNDNRTGVTVFESYSEKEHKGQRFELRLDKSKWKEMPYLEMRNQDVIFHDVTLKGKSYWIAVIEPRLAGIDLEKFKKSPMQYLRKVHINSCKMLFRAS